MPQRHARERPEAKTRRRPKPLNSPHPSKKVELSISYIPLSEAVKWDRNPKGHALGLLIESIRRYGFRDAPILDRTLGAIVAGNGRIEALEVMRANQEKVPEGVRVDEAGEWLVPVQGGIDAVSVEEAEAFGLDHNNLVVVGGTFEPDAVLNLWHQEGLAEILAGLEMRPVTLPEEVEPEAGGRDWQSPGRIDTRVAGSVIVRPVFSMKQAETLELAIRRTGIANRADALEEICVQYLERAEEG